MIKTLLLAMFMTFATMTVAHAEPTERESLVETFSLLSKSVGALYILEDDGDLRFTCSATAVDRYENKTVILTAYHCIRKGVSYLINFGDNVFRSLSVWKIPHYELNKVKYPRAFDEPKTDMALFLLEGTDIPTVNIGDSSSVVNGEKIAMVGFPLGLAKISYEGILSGRFNRPGSDDYNYLLLQIFGAPGSSGSAVMSLKDNTVIGVLVSGKTGRSGLPVIFATPVNYKQYLKSVHEVDRDEQE